MWGMVGVVLLLAVIAAQIVGSGRETALLAFVTERDGNPEIYVHDFASGRVMNVSGDAGFDVRPAWSLDGH
jgi:hypothetical protein